MPRVNKAIEDMSAEELYALAREREQREAERAEKERSKKRDKLKAKRRELLVHQRKELAALDREIQRLGATPGRRSPGRSRRAAGGASMVQQICDIVATQPEMTTADIRAKAEAGGMEIRNLSQVLAYLKRQGRLVSRGHGIYATP